jgi:hypothetical protein
MLLLAVAAPVLLRSVMDYGEHGYVTSGTTRRSSRPPQHARRDGFSFIYQPGELGIFERCGLILGP